MVVLKPNSIDAIRWGLKNYDGAEFDVRISEDDIPVIYHDTYLHGTIRRVQDQTVEQLREHDIATLEDLLTDEGIIDLANNQNKILWLELKPDCKVWNRIQRTDHIDRMFRLVDDVIVNKGEVRVEQINIFSFAEKLLMPFVYDDKYRVYKIVPDIDECDTRSGLVRQILSLGRYFKRSLIYHGEKLKKMGFDGMLFPHQYVDGFRAFFHPSMEKVENTLHTDEFDLITQAKTIEQEEKYPNLIRFTDHANPADCPRATGVYSNHIVIHRGCGVEELEV